MAKIQIKSEKLTPFGGIFAIMEKFDSLLSHIIDSTLGLRCTSYGYQYSEIIRSLMSVYFCGGSCVEDVTTHLMPNLSMHPTLRTCSADTILRAIKELTVENTSYTSDTGKSYNFNTADKLNTLLLNALLATGELESGKEYDFDFDHQYIETENTRLESAGIRINRARMDCGSCSESIVEMVERYCNHFYIRANKCGSLYNDMFALTGWKKEEINGIEFELNSIIVEKWKGKAYRLVIQRQKRMDGESDLWEGEYTYRCIPLLTTILRLCVKSLNSTT